MGDAGPTPGIKTRYCDHDRSAPRTSQMAVEVVGHTAIGAVNQHHGTGCTSGLRQPDDLLHRAVIHHPTRGKQLDYKDSPTAQLVP